MLCPKCGHDDVDLIGRANFRDHYYCYWCKKGFYVFMKPKKKRSARRTGKKGG